MRESIGGTWLFQIVIVFVLLFAGYICLSINHSKAFAIKNDIILELQRNGEYNANAQKNVEALLKKAGYRTSGKCDNGYEGYDRNGAKLTNSKSNNAVFCLKKFNITDIYPEYPVSYYYKVKVFYQLDLPVLNSVMSFTVTGDTGTIFPARVK